MGEIALSIVVPCRNEARWIDQQLEALTRQRIEGDWEVIVVDDGSTDGTLDVVSRYEDRLPLVKMSAPPGPPSPARPRNFGVRAARGEFVVFCDADDVVEDGWAEAMQAAFREHDFITAYETEEGGINSPATIGAYGRMHKGLWYGNNDFPVPFAPTGAIGIRRTLHEKVGGFDETLIRGGEDEDYCWRVQLETGTPLVFVPDAVIHYRYRTRLREMFRQARNGGASKVYLYQKWGDRMTVPRNQWSAAFWAWLRVLAQLAVVRDRGSLGLWVRWVGKLLGHAEGSVHLRVLLLCSYPDLAKPPNFRSGAKRVASRSESVNLPW